MTPPCPCSHIYGRHLEGRCCTDVGDNGLCECEGIRADNEECDAALRNLERVRATRVKESTNG